MHNPEHADDDHRHGSGHAHHHGRVGETRLGLAALLTGAFMMAEVAGGIWSGSLALLADAGHMLTDFAGLALAWYAFRLARRPADWRRTYGFDRFTILAAFANGIALFAIAAWICVEALHRFREPQPVMGGVLLSVALAGLVVNLAALWILRGGDRTSLNIRAAMLHVIGDLLGSAAALVAGIVIITSGWTLIDPILSVLIALVVLRSAWGVVKESGHILLEGAPLGLEAGKISSDVVQAIPEVHDVHHVHAWSITENRHMVTLHARVSHAGPPELVVARIKQRLAQRFGVAHATVELEYDDCADEEDTRAAAASPARGH